MFHLYLWRNLSLFRLPLPPILLSHMPTLKYSYYGPLRWSADHWLFYRTFSPHVWVLHSLPTATSIYDFLSYTLWEAVFDSLPHMVHHSISPYLHGSCPMDCWYDDDFKSFHQRLCFSLIHDPPSIPNTRTKHRCLLIQMKCEFLESRRLKLLDTLHHSPIAFWHNLLPRKTPTSDIDPQAWVSYVNTLYDVLD